MNWRPNSKPQEDFLAIPDEVREGLYGGQAGGGKSEVLLYLPLTRQFHQYPKFKGIILRRTLPELKRELIPRAEVDGLYKACGANWNAQDKYFKFPSGALMMFGHVENEKDVSIYDTAQFNYIAFDEATSFTPYQYDFLTFSRCRSADGNLPAFTRAGTNPGGVSHNYFRKRFVEPFRDGGKIINETRFINGRYVSTKLIFIRARAQDNIDLMRNDPNYLNNLQFLPEAERIAKAEGDWWIYSGLVFDDFRAVRLPSEPENACHVIEPFKIPDYWPRVLSIDWGYSAMTHALWAAINPLPNAVAPAKIYFYREYAAKKQKISEWATNLKILSHGENIRDVVLDPSAFGNRGDERTIAEQFADSFGREARRADNDRIGGKLLVQEYLRWNTRNNIVPIGQYDHAIAMEIYRISGDEGVEKYRKSFLHQESEDFLPKMQIFNTLPVLIDVFSDCIYDKNNVEDVAEFGGDDPYDNLRYNLKACQNLLNTGQKTHQLEAERTEILNHLAVSNNQTAFYMNMQNFERRELRAARPIARRHRGIRRIA